MPPTRTIEILPTAADLFHAAAEEFVKVGRQAIGAQGRFAVALSGGSTPKSLYSLLASSYPDFPGRAPTSSLATSAMSRPPIPRAITAW